MKIYNFDAFTGYYLNESVADESPLEPGVFLIPAHATNVAPPTPTASTYPCYINGEWQLLDIEIPQELDPRETMQVTAFQAHAAIARAGLYEQVEELMSNPETSLEVRLAWQKAQTFKRLSPTVLTLGAALGLDDEALDNLFALAATIDA